MACLYGIEGKVVLLDVKSGETPLRVKIDLLGYHGVSDRMYELTGQHKYVTVPALPDSLNSETARDLKVEEIDPVTATAWLKRRSNESVQAYHYQDHVVFTHTSYLSEVLHHPSEETFTIGLSSDSKIWNEYPKGTTYCSHTGSLHFVPFPVQSCLMDHVVTLDCTTSGPLRCHHPEGSTMGINGLELKAIHPFITPFDYKIEMNSDITLCKNLRNSYYDESALSVTFPNGKVIDRSGKGMVPPLGAGSQLIDEVLFCDQMDYYVPPRSAFVGLMGTDLSFNYRPDTAKLEIYTTRHNSMRNSWPDVIVINICLLTFIHWLSDRDKSVRLVHYI